MTPSTMLATSERVRPWSARWSFASDGRSTRISSLVDHDLHVGMHVERRARPWGPSPSDAVPVSLTSTPFGIGHRQSSDSRHRFSPPYQTSAMSSPPTPWSRAARSESTPAGGGQDGHAETVADPRDLVRAHVVPAARTGDALEVPDDRLAVVILEVDPEHTEAAVLEHLVASARSGSPEQPSDLDLRLGHGHVDPLVATPVRRSGCGSACPRSDQSS